MNPNSTPPEGLYGRESDERGDKTAGGVSAEKVAQAGAQGLDPRSRIRDTIHTTLNAGGYWLPIEAQHAIVDALAQLPLHDVTDWRQEAAKATKRASELAEVLDDVLRLFIHKGHPGEPCLRTSWTSETTIQQWRDTLYKPKEQP